MKGAVNIPILQGALARIDNAIAYNGLDDIFEIAAKYTSSIARGHALPDANKRTGLAVGLEYLSLNDYEVTIDNDLLADAVRDLVIGDINEPDFADILYSCFIASKNQI
ncbi:type II toxin-antitoxin system death-on-curing family toxin [Pseudomonas sp. MYb118]|uniref:type II toxin-antitoxin system death-on-curing family toxin n=1 Tax=Pseudomonas sp. MYb118 TaxID=1848720 RepID=UPI0034CD0F30